MAELPSPSAITLPTFKAALELYPIIVDSVYKSKLKDPKKVSEALARDEWRFEELPASLAAAKSEGKEKARGLSKETVERLVQWKITHGHSRPFLPAMVRKNDGSAIEKQTSLGFEKLGTPSRYSVTTLSAALDLVCKLNGIGPATGTLILNVFDPVNIPFFQDELFLWLFPELKGGKLKYTQKEYLQLYGAVNPVLKRLGVTALDLEKVTYVLWHKDLLGDHDKARLEQVLAQSLSSVQEENAGGPEDGTEADGKPTTTTKNNLDGQIQKPKGTKREADASPTEDDKPPIKRPSRRNKR